MEYRYRARESLVPVGVLALQGSFREHAECLVRLGVQPVLVRRPGQLMDVGGLIIPGGESTTIRRLLDRYGFVAPIRRLAKSGMPVYGSCAGMILVARELADGDEPPLRLIDIRVKRNAFGRQLESFETALEIPCLGRRPFPGVFIRAPWIEHTGGEVSVLAQLPTGTVVAAEQNNLLVSAFHPELTPDTRFHEYFLREVTRFVARR